MGDAAMVDRMEGLEASPGLRVDDLKERALEFTAAAREKLSGGSQVLRDYIVKEPVRALGVAVGMGVLLGWLIKRR
jgi:ElaB/YqjD/DUF883 family membrane-anchored ribosome-binding protein